MRAYFVVVAVFFAATGANTLPQYPANQQQQFYAYNPQEPAKAPSVQQAVFARPPRQSRYGGGGGGQAGPGASTECQRQEVGPGRFKFVCGGINPDQITIRNEHILWLTSDASGPQVVDIEVPNYKIDELIKAGYKTGGGGSTQINVLLKKPEQTAEAEVDVPKSAAGQTSVNLQYEAPTKQLVHFPNDQPYRPLSGPILPPLAGGRGRRNTEGSFTPYQPYQY